MALSRDRFVCGLLSAVGATTTFQADTIDDWVRGRELKPGQQQPTQKKPTPAQQQEEPVGLPNERMREIAYKLPRSRSE